MTNAEQLARALQVSTGTVRGWEQGTSLPTGESAWRLFHLLGPDLFADLMPHLQDEAIEVPVGEGGEARATIVALRGSVPQRLAHLVRVAEEIARGDG